MGLTRRLCMSRSLKLVLKEIARKTVTAINHIGFTYKLVCVFKKTHFHVNEPNNCLSKNI